MVYFALALILTVGTAMAGLFLPGTLSECNSASDWNNATDGRNFFVAANGTWHSGDSGTTTPKSICKDTMTAWILAIVVMYVRAALFLLKDCTLTDGSEYFTTSVALSQ